LVGTMESCVPANLIVSNSSVLSFACITMGLALVSSYLSAVVLAGHPVWPIQDISWYGASYPAVYLFRPATIVAGTSLAVVGITWLRQKRPDAGCVDHGRSPSNWPALSLFITGVSLMGTGSVTAQENVWLHAVFAIAHFVSTAVLISIVPFGCNANWYSRAFRVVAAGNTWFCLGIYALMSANVIVRSKLILSVMEWYGCMLNMTFLYWYANCILPHISPVSRNTRQQ